MLVTPPTLVFTTPSGSISPPAQALATSSSADPISYLVSPQVATPLGGNWLRVSPASGQAAGSVQVSVQPDNLSQGVDDGSVVFTPKDAIINSVAVPIRLVIGCGQGGCGGPPATILSVVNGASFHPGGAPGAAMTIFGVNLADARYQAPANPLPMRLGSTSVTVNGSPVPLCYASPTRINFQMPFNTPPGSDKWRLPTA